VNFNIEKLTLNEIELFEETTNASIDTIMSAGSPKGKPLKVLVWIALRRTNPSVTLEEAGETTFDALMDSFGEGPKKKGN
jgi:hypothetical protein